MKHTLLTLSFFLSFSYPSFCQKIDFLGLEQGLSSGFVFDFIESSKGYIYIGLHTGLIRYDGYNIEHFKHNPFDPYSISPLAVSNLAEDKRGYIWIGMENGALDVFNPRTKRFHHFGKVSSHNDKHLKAIEAIIIDSNDHIWLALQTGKVIKLEISEDFDLEKMPASIPFEPMLAYSFQVVSNSNFSMINEESSSSIKKFFFDKKENLWALTEDAQLYKIDWKMNEYHIIYKAEGKEDNESNQIFENGKDLYFRGGKHWIKINNSNSNSNKVDTIQVSRWFQDANFYGSDKNGALVYSKSDYKSNKTHFYRSDPNILTTKKNNKGPFYTLDYNNLGNLKIGESGLFWIKGKFGLHKYNPEIKYFKHHLPQYSLRKISEDKEGHIFINHDYRGIYLFDQKNDKLEKISSIYPKIDFLVQHLFFDKNGAIWGQKFPFDNARNKIIYERPFFKFDPKSNELSEYQFPIDFREWRISLTDKQDRIWILTNTNNLLLFDTEKKEEKIIATNKALKKFKENIVIDGLYVDYNDQLWMATTNGAILTNSNMFPNKSLDFKVFETNPSDKSSLSNNWVKCFHDDPYEPEKYIWIGTAGGGLNRLNRATKTFTHFTTHNSDIPDDVVYQIQVDNLGRLWLSTNKGLTRFDIKNETFKNFTTEDGLQNLEFNTGSSLKLSNGALLFGGVNGLNIFHPDKDSINYSNYIPPIRLTSLWVNHKKVQVYPKIDSINFELHQAIDYVKSINLDHNQNTIQIHFAAFDFTSSKKNSYRYRLIKNGKTSYSSNDNWVGLGHENKVQFSNLSPGTYLFEVKGSNHQGLWNEIPTTLKININPPWWKSSWAFLFYFLVFFTLLYLVYRNLIRRANLKEELKYKQKETERLAELDRIKTDFFSSITHEFRTPLTLILEPLRQILKEDHDDKIYERLTLAKNNSDKLLQLVNQLLDISKLEAGKMQIDLRKGNIIKTLQPIVQSFQALVLRKNIELIFNAPDKIDLFYYDKDHLEKVFFNLLSNAIKFTGKGAVIIDTYINQEKLIIQIKDTGIGISKEEIANIFDRFYQVDDFSNRKKQGTGIGLALTKDLVDLMGATIEVKSKIEEGTLFKISLPMDLVDIRKMEHEYLQREDSIVKPEYSETIEPFQPISNNENGSNDKDLVLLIEDNDELRTFIMQSLQGDFHIVAASNGEQGIQKAKELIPDLVISDLMMPLKDGFEVVNELKNDIITSHIPIILLTAKAAIESKLQGLSHGADDYLTKPFNTEELLVRISNLIEIRKKLRLRFSESLVKSIDKPNSISSLDAAFLIKIKDILDENLSNSTFSVESLSKQVFMSRSQLYRKLKALTGQSPVQFIRNYRLDQAIKWLKEGTKYNVSEIAMEIGFEDVKYFSKRFKERFSLSPSDVR